MLHTVAPIPAGILGFVSAAATWSLQLQSRKCQNSPRKAHDSHTSASISFMCPQCWVRSKATLMTAFPINSSFPKNPFSSQREHPKWERLENPILEFPSAPLKHHSTGRIWEMQFHQSFIYQQIPQFVSLRLPQQGCAVCKEVGQHWGNAGWNWYKENPVKGDTSHRRAEENGFWLLLAMEK